MTSQVMLWLLITSSVLLQQLVQSTTLADRLNCKPGDEVPNTRVDTSGRLTNFRTQLASARVNAGTVDAFIIGSGDAHNSEYPSAFDRRRGFISGFSGSWGTAVVTQTSAAVWVDGRYYNEAEKVLDCNWILMKYGMPETPTVAEWINSQLNNTNGQQVGVDSSLVTHTYFTSMTEDLQHMSNSPVLVSVPTNPVDAVWTTGRPAQPSNSINALPTQFAGKSWDEKVKDVQTELNTKNVIAYAVTSLDEVAWLFNLRGSDVDFNPFFLGYAIVERTKVSLYIRDYMTRLQEKPTDAQTNETLMTHLRTSATGSCTSMPAPCVQVFEYGQTAVENDLQAIAQNSGLKVWISYSANYAIYTVLTAAKVMADKSPIALVKSQKNSVERQGMQNSHNRDSAALIKFLAFLEQEIESGNSWTEVSAGKELDQRRRTLLYSRGLSFETISSYGSNGAVIHYRPSKETDKAIGTDSLYLLDSGGQYLDGTTDVTRTMHYGTPTAFQKECYTRVLMGAINLASLKWPSGLYGRQIDAIARYQLWEAGLNYRHGTGHGIGAYLSVHEGPGRIALTSRASKSDEPLSLHQYFSDEPGYYEDNQFGIRLETIVMIRKNTPTYSNFGEPFLEFKPVTLVPFEPKLIDFSLMNTQQRKWYNSYNAMVRSNIRPLVAGDQRATDWLDARTLVISEASDEACGGTGLAGSTLLTLLATTLAVFGYFL